MLIIRYRLETNENFESIKINGINCFLDEFKCFIATKLSWSETHYSKDDYHLFISNTNTHEGLNKNLFFVDQSFFLFCLFRIQRSFGFNSKKFFFT